MESLSYIYFAGVSGTGKGNMTLLQLFLVNLVIFLPGSGSVEVEVLEPIRMDGDEVGLIFIPERYMRGDQYRKTGSLRERKFIQY